MKKLGTTAGVYALFLSAASAQVQVKPLLDDLGGEVGTASLSPDGKTLAFDWCGSDFTRCGIYTRAFAGGPMKLLIDGNNRSVGRPRWSPDGNLIAFTQYQDRWDIRLFVRDLASGVERDVGRFCQNRDGESAPSWSSDSRWIAANRDMGDMACAPALFPAAGGPAVRNLAESGSSPVFSPDGRLLAYVEGGSLQLLHLGPDYRPARPPATLVQEPRQIVGVTWTRDGKWIWYEVLGDAPSGAWQTYLRRIAPGLGAQPQPVPDLANRLSISSIFEFTDGGALAQVTHSLEPSWARADLRSTPLKIETAPEPGCFADSPADTLALYIPPWPSAACSPYGRQRAYISTRTGLADIRVANGDGTNDRVLVKSILEAGDHRWDVDEIPHLAGWSPDGKWISVIVHPLFGDHGSDYANLYIVPASGGQPRLLAENIIDFAWSPDSQSVVISPDAPQAPGPLVRVNLPDGKKTPLAVTGSSPKFSPDGQWLYFLSGSWQESKLARIPVRGGAVESLGDASRAKFLVADKYLYLFRRRQLRPGALVEDIFRVDPQTHLTTPLGELPAFSSASFSPDGRYLYFAPNQNDSSKRRLVLLHGL